MRDLFYSLCGDDPACKPNLPTWQGFFSRWTIPSESGVCINLISGTKVYVDKDNPYTDGSTWAQLDLKAIHLPAKQSVAPLLTYMENQCHQGSSCGASLGNWQKTSTAINEQIK